MKLFNVANWLVVGLILTGAAAGCRKNPESVKNIPGRTEPVPRYAEPARSIVPDIQPRATPRQTPPPEIVESRPQIDPEQRMAWPRDRAILAPYTAHFAYDSSVVQAEDKPKVAAVADYLKSHALTAVEIEGHCDERGTEEYNRALGERRALALREELISLGIDFKRIDTTSYGKDRPVATGHDESAWKQNRRGEFVLETPPK
jgi:peptidoglycan-associated lipoprotein